MKAKSKPPPDDPEQAKRFIEAAKQHGAESGDAFARVLKNVIPQRRKRAKKAT